jgi:hypothetical protein
MLKFIAVAFPFCFIIEVLELFPINAISHLGFDANVNEPVITYVPSGKYTEPVLAAWEADIAV